MLFRSYLKSLDQGSTSQIYEQYKLVTKDSKLSYRRVSEILNDLENSGIIHSEKHSSSKIGYGKKYRLIYPPGMVGPLVDPNWWINLKVELQDKLRSEPPILKNPPKSGHSSPFSKWSSILKDNDPKQVSKDFEYDYGQNTQKSGSDSNSAKKTNTEQTKGTRLGQDGQEFIDGEFSW